MSSLRIVSYNVRYFGHPLRGLASTRGGKRAIAQALLSLDPLPSIICLQEVETRSMRSTLAFRGSPPEATQLDAFMEELERTWKEERGTAFPYQGFYFPAHAQRLGKTHLASMGLAILVDVSSVLVDRHNARRPHRITHHHLEIWKERKQTRICAHMRLGDSSGRAFHVFNTHLSLPTPFHRAFWSAKGRMGYGVNQLSEAKKLIAYVRSQSAGEPFVVCGDFNSQPGSPVYRYLTEEAGLVGVQERLGQLDQAARFPTAGFMSMRMHLDHLFSGGPLTWIDLEGTVPFGSRASPFHGKSDHVPLIARFRVGKRGDSQVRARIPGRRWAG